MCPGEMCQKVLRVRGQLSVSDLHVYCLCVTILTLGLIRSFTEDYHFRIPNLFQNLDTTGVHHCLTSQSL